MSRRRRRTRHGSSPRRRRAIGIAVLLGLALVVYAVFVRSVPWSEPWTLRAVFANSAQITAGSPVRVAGLQVGRVAGVGRGRGTTAVVTMDISDTGRPIHADATAVIRPRLFLEGSYYIDLHPGSPSTPAVSSGHTLPLPQTTIPVSFATVLSTFTTPVRSGLIDIVDGFAHGLSRGGASGLNAGVRDLGPALRDTAIASQAAGGTAPDDVTHLIEGADRVTQALSADTPALTSGIRAEDRVASALAARDAALTDSIRGVDATFVAAPPELRTISSSLPGLQAFADRLEPSLRAAPPVLARVDALLGQLTPLLARPALPRLVAVLGPLADQAVSLTSKLADLFPRVRAVSSCAANQLLGLLDTTLQDGKLSTGQTVWQELVHVNVGLASANQDFDAAGARVRFATNIQPNLLAVGSVPGVGALLQNTEQPLLGIRPQWSGPTPPPVHPEVACATQPLGDLQAASTAIPSSASTPVTLDVAKLGSLLHQRLGRAAQGWTP